MLTPPPPTTVYTNAENSLSFTIPDRSLMLSLPPYPESPKELN